MILLDTHALIWSQMAPSPLPERVRDRIAKAERQVISAVTCWEVSTLLAKGKLGLDRPLRQWLADLRADPQVQLVSLTPDASVLMHELERTGFHADPADRLLYATALTLGIPFLTKDTRVHAYASSELPAHLRAECVWDN